MVSPSGKRRLGLGSILAVMLTLGLIPQALGTEDPPTTTSLVPESAGASLVELEPTTTTVTVAADEPSHDEPSHGGQQDRLVCSDIDPTWKQLAITGHPVSGHYTVSDDFRTVQFAVVDYSAGGKAVNWHSDGPIDAVILRSGQDAATYEYEPPATFDTGLLPPLKDREGRNLAAVLACYDPAGAVVEIDLSLVDSDDPVNVGENFEYLIEVRTTDPLTDSEIVFTLPTGVTFVTAPDCAVEGTTVTCSPQLAENASWTTVVTVSAVTGGNAIAIARLQGWAGDRPIDVTAMEVTRVIASGHSDGCGGHEDDDASDGDECGDGRSALIAACSAIDPTAATVVLPGPFANRQYLVKGPGGARIWVTVSESTGTQTASWSANMPIDGVLARTGRDLAEYRYEPITFNGTGIVGPPGGRSGGARPIADLAFCYLQRHVVDVGVGEAAMPPLAVGVPGVLEFSLTNTGYRDAVAVSAVIDPGDHAEVVGCVPVPLVGGKCQIGTIRPGERPILEVELLGRSAGEGELTIEVGAFNESGEAVGDNVLRLAYVVVSDDSAGTPTTVVETDDSAGTPTTVPEGDGDVEAPTELPFTGPGPESVWLAVLAGVLVTTGGLLVMVRLPQRRRSL